MTWTYIYNDSTTLDYRRNNYYNIVGKVGTTSCINCLVGSLTRAAGGYSEYDLHTVNGSQSGVQGGVSAARNHSPQQLSLDLQLSR